MVRPVTDDDVGLRLLYQATVVDGIADNTVDIVAVHGLGAHPDDTWSTRREAESEPVWVNWLKESDMLPAAVPKTRIMRYGYKSGWFGRNSVKKTARTVAQTLLLALRRERETCPTRPLIFIGHSFGGLVVLKALVEAHDEEAEWPGLFDSMVGMIFLGTPFRGADGMSQSEMLRAAAREYDDEDIEKDPLLILDPGNEILQDLVDRFCKTWSRSHRAPVACFFEQQASEVGAIVGKERRRAFVVNERSGCLDLSDRVKKYPMDKTHFTINKFSKPTEEGFLIVRDVISEMVKHAQKLRQPVSSSSGEHTERSLRASVSTPVIESTYSRVCKRRVKDFIGRESQLQEMQLYFSDKGAEQPRILILQALGGQGKSQIALEYCRQSGSTYRGIFWVNGNLETTVIQSFGSLAAELSERSILVSGDAEMKIRIVKSVLEQWDERWLLVFDNYNDPVSFRNVERFFPSRGHGDILFTSRHKGLDRLGTVLEVPPMPTLDGVNLLLRGYLNINVNDHIEEGKKIVTRLGDLALAIDQAAAYIQYKKLPIERLANFLTLYEALRKKILRHTSPHFWKYSTIQIHGKEEQDKAISAFTTWEMSFQQFTYGGPQTTKDAGHFLSLSAFFDPSRINESIFRYRWNKVASRPVWMRIFANTSKMVSDEESSLSGDDVGVRDDDADHVNLDDLEQSVWDRERFWDIITKAHTLSLLESISTDSDEREVNFSLHPLIRDWLQLREKIEQRRGYTQEAIDFVVSAIQVYETISTTYYQKELLRTHADACILNDERFSLDNQALGRDIANCGAASWFAGFYKDQGRYGISEKLERLIMRTREMVLGKEHPDTLSSMNNLADVLSYQGKYEQAENMHQQVLNLRQTGLGKEYPGILSSMNNLANVLTHQGKYEQAEEMLEQVLRLSKTMLGKEHPNTLLSINNLAGVLSRQGKYKQAEDMHQQVLELIEMAMGKEHPSTLSSMNNLAIVLSDQGKYEQGEEIHRQVIGLRETVLGKEHPDTLSSMNNLATMLSDQDKDEQAEEIHRQVLEVKETVLGKEHPSTLTSINNLALTLSKQGKYKRAEVMHRQVLGFREIVLGKEHPFTLSSMGNLATVLSGQGEYDQAEKIHRQVLKLMETVLGEKHPETLTNMSNLANVLNGQGKFSQAEKMYRQVLKLMETVLGKEHPKTLSSMNNLSFVLSFQGKYEQAIEIHQQVLGLRETVLARERASRHSQA